MGDRIEIRDPVHDFIVVRGRERNLLETPLMQRLREIHQLALARLVYPGALHRRFDHTLGVLHIADLMCKQLEEYVPQSRWQTIRFAALIHDTGHGPFSHVSESVLDALAPQNLASSAGKKDKIHELITRKIITRHPDLAQSLSGLEREEIAALLGDGLDDGLFKSIISGPLDADKQDYLLRDAFFCGVKYGTYDIAQLHRCLGVARDGQEMQLVVGESGVHTLEQFVLAKYYMTTQVYRHKIRLVTDAMLVRALTLGVTADKIGALRDLYVYADTDQFMHNYLKWDDSRLTVEMLRPEYESTKAGAMFRMLANRQLFKRVYSMRLGELDPKVRVALPQKIGAIRGNLEQEIAARLSEFQGREVLPEHVVLHLHTIDSVRKQSRNSEGSILIKKRDGKLRKFEDESVLFKSIDEKLKEVVVECYARVTFKDDKAKRDQLDQMRSYVTNLLESPAVLGK